MVGVRRQELAYQIAVAGVDLDTVKTGFPGKVHRLAEILYQRVYLILPESPHESRRI